MAGGETDGENGLCGVDGMGEEVGCEGESADSVEHYIELRLFGLGAVSFVDRVSGRMVDSALVKCTSTRTCYQGALNDLLKPIQCQNCEPISW